MAEQRRTPVDVVLLRRDPEDLTSEEFAIIRGSFPGRELRFSRRDPRDYREHDRQCQEFMYNPVVILPFERPIPSLAMEHGVPHVVVTPQGLMELLPLVPQFRPFQARE